MIIGNIRVEAWSPSLAFFGFGKQTLQDFDYLLINLASDNLMMINQ